MSLFDPQDVKSEEVISKRFEKGGIEKQIRGIEDHN